MSRFSIGIAHRNTNAHVACFEDFAEALADALRALGHEVVGFDNPGRLILFGAGRMVDNVVVMPKDAILYNTEQVASSIGAQQFDFERHADKVVWDYSESNIEFLRANGAKRAVHCPIGYVSSMSKIAPVEEDIDVLFYGSMNARRRNILDALDKEGLHVEYVYGKYGAERDHYIARSKIVLNMHFYDKPVFEIFRVSHLLANKKCVVSEGGGQDATLEAFAAKATMLVPYGSLVATCKSLLDHDGDASVARRQIADKGFEEFKKLDLVENVRRALEQSEVAS